MQTLGEKRMMIQEAAMVLHRKQCPFDYHCRATDCIECQREYEKVDTSGADETAIVNTVPGGDKNMEEIL